MIWYKAFKFSRRSFYSLLLEKKLLMAKPFVSVYNGHHKEGYMMVEFRVLAQNEGLQIDTANNTAVLVCTSGSVLYSGGTSGQSGRCGFGESATFPSNSGSYVINAEVDNTIVVIARFFVI